MCFLGILEVCCGSEEEERKSTWIDDADGEISETEHTKVSIRNKAATALCMKRRETICSKPVDPMCQDALPKYPKTLEEVEYLRKKLKAYFIFEDLPEEELMVLIDAFERLIVPKGTTIGKQNEEEEYFYLLQEGHVDLYCEIGKHCVGQVGEGCAFGEAALFYGCKRSKTQKAATDLTCWRVSQFTFRSILARKANAYDNNLRGKLKQIDLFHGLDDNTLLKFASSMVQVNFEAEDLIVRKGEEGDVFYIIEEGSVKVHDIGIGDSQSIDHVLSAGDWFGEKALLTEEPRSANVTALTNVKTLAMDRETFKNSIGELQALLEHKSRVRSVKVIPIFANSNIEDVEVDQLARLAQEMCFKKGTKLAEAGRPYQQNIWMIRHGRLLVYGTKSDKIYNLTVGDYFGDKSVLGDADHISSHDAVCEENLTTWVLSREVIEAVIGDLDRLGKPASYQKTKGEKKIRLKDLKKHRILGVGGFGRVWLVESIKTGEPYALKMMSKRKVLDAKLASSVIREKELLTMLDHPFILGLHSSFQDESNLYLVLPLIQGGELFSVVSNAVQTGGAKGVALQNNHAAFYAACVIEALGHFHHRHIAYRDLKLENVMIDAQGYGKIVDLGFAKIVLDKTYTFCGTPEYIAPEVIVSKGHNHVADYWSYGVLLYEMLVGRAPFSIQSSNGQVMELFKLIVKVNYTLPKVISGEGQDLIRKLLVRKQRDRLGNLSRGHIDIIMHPWFAKSECYYNKLLKRELPAPWVPDVKNPLDSSNFDDYKSIEGQVERGTFLSEKEQSLFKGF